MIMISGCRVFVLVDRASVKVRLAVVAYTYAFVR